MENKRRDITALLIEMHFTRMDKPSNFEDIVDFCVKDINETADADNWTSEDVTIAFRRWIESNAANVQPKKTEHELYFDIVSHGYNEELQREEIQIHAGKNGNVFLIKTDVGFIVDVYNQHDHVSVLGILEDDLTPEEEDDSDVIFDFTYSKVMAFIKKWGVSEVNSVNVHFFEKTNNVWIPKQLPEYTEEEQAIADYLQQPVT